MNEAYLGHTQLLTQAQSSNSPLRPARRSHHLHEHAGEAVFNKAACVCRETRPFQSSREVFRKEPWKPTSKRVVKDGREGHNMNLTNSDRQRSRQSCGCFSCFPPLRSKCSSHQVPKEGDGHGKLPSRVNTKCSVTAAKCRAGTASGTNSQPQISVTLNPIRTKTQTSPHMNAITSCKPPQVVGPPGARSQASTITIIKPLATQAHPKSSKASMAKTSPISSLTKPHLALPIMKASSKSTSSPPMNISKPQPAEDFVFVTRKTSPMNLKLPSPEKKVAMVGQNNTHRVCVDRGMKPVVRCRGHLPETQKEPYRTKLDHNELTRENPSVVWREGLLQRLGRMHGLGNCKLSLEELIELDDNSFLHEEIHSRPQGVPLPPTIQAPSRASMASTWKVEFERGRPILPLQREDVKKPELVKSSAWPFSHTNSLFEASRRHYGNYEYEEWR